MPVVLDGRELTALDVLELVQEPGRGVCERRTVRLMVVGAVADVAPLVREQVSEHVLRLPARQMPGGGLPAGQVGGSEAAGGLLGLAARDARLDEPDGPVATFDELQVAGDAGHRHPICASRTMHSLSSAIRLLTAFSVALRAMPRCLTCGRITTGSRCPPCRRQSPYQQPAWRALSDFVVSPG